MEYFKINNIDFSGYVSGLKVSKAANYTTQTNAAGNTVIDYINSKRTIEAAIKPLTQGQMLALNNALSNINVSVSYLSPETNTLETITAFLAVKDLEYYTIQPTKTLFNPFTLTFIEL